MALAIPTLSEATIRAHATPESYSRGRNYYERGAVTDLALRDNVLQAAVEGSQYTPYRVRVTFDQAGITDATCTCLYDMGGWCKHIVATLLAGLYASKEIETRPTLESLLSDLDRAQLQALLVDLAGRDSDLADAIERQVVLLRLANAAPQARHVGQRARQSSIDQQAIKQQVRLTMRAAGRDRYDDYDYYDEEDPGDEIVEGVRPLLEQARRFIEGGDASSALYILEALTDEYLDGCRALYDRFEEMYGSFEGAASDFFGELAEAWAEAILSVDLSADERDEWGEKIAGWRDEADDLGAGAAFDLALTAADQGWEYPPLLRVFAGEITEKGAWEGESPVYSDELALVRLRVLERQGRYQEYLYLAEAEGQTERYIVMLAKLGRTQEAVEEGLKYLTTPNDTFEVARALRERGDLEGALRIAEHGMALTAPNEDAIVYGIFAEHNKAPLATWAADLAAGMGYDERARHAAEVAFHAAPSLDTYGKAQSLADERWAEVKPGLLADLRRSHSAAAKVDIFLHEGLIDDAIAAVTDGYSYGLLERVIDAAIATRPDWAIKAASTQAERIMDAGDAQHYDRAVDWLRRARDAFRSAGRQADWQGYLSSIRTKHGRKYKLMGLLKGL
jgi:uncharacterized Zn finger protein